MRWCFLIVASFCLFAVAASAQNDDRGLIVGFLEEQLSGAGRDIRLNGFEGALSGRATLDELTIADDAGPWLTLRGVVLDWNRSALFRGRLEVSELSAQELLLPRLPPSADETPQAEATGFTLPELPISVEIGRLAIENAQIGESVLGQDVAARLEGMLGLTGGQAEIALDLARTDANRGQLSLKAALIDDQLSVDLAANEAAGGIVSSLLDLPGRPSLEARINGEGPVTAFRADIALASDGTPRITGSVTLGPDQFEAEITGDITPLLAPDTRDFFGPELALIARGSRGADGDLALDQFDLRAEMLRLRGQAQLSADGVPLAFDLQGEMKDETGAPVVLPGADVTVASAELTAVFDGVRSPDWTLRATLRDAGIPNSGRLERVELEVDGMLSAPGETPFVNANVKATVQGITLDDAALSTAVGTQASATGRVAWAQDAPLEITGLRLAGQDYSLALDGTLSFIERQLNAKGTATLRAEDLSRFSQLAGTELRGAVAGRLAGEGDPLGGTFDAKLDVSATNLKSGITALDPLLADGVALSGAANRGPQGLLVQDLRIAAKGFETVLNGRVASEASDLDLSAALEDISVLVPDLSGPVRLAGRAKASGSLWDLNLRGSGPEGVVGRIDGQYDPAGASAFDIDLTAPRLSAFVPDLPGGAQVRGSLKQAPNAMWDVDLTASGPYRSTVQAVGTLGATQSALDVEAQLPDLAVLVPQFPGPARISGQIEDIGSGRFAVDLTGSAPFSVTASVRGTLAAQNSAVDVTLGLPNIAPLAPGYTGPFSATGDIRDEGAGTLAINLTANGPYGLRATTNGTVGANTAVDVTARLPDIGAVVPALAGAVAARGSVAQVSSDWQIDLTSDGPGSAQTNISGVVAGDGSSAALNMTGSAPLALANRSIAPRSVLGMARFDLALNGPPTLSSLTGQVSTRNARLSLPLFQKALEDIEAQINLASGRAQVSVQSAFSDGGRLTVDGPVELYGGQSASLNVRLDTIRLRDPSLYETQVNGAIQVRGQLAGGARITGALELGETNVRVPESGLSFGGDIPPITHLGASGPVRKSLGRAGLSLRPQGTAQASSGGPSYPLDLMVTAPARIFVRGRGLDAELGGQLRLTGTSTAVVPVGQFDLIRGRIDVLAKRLVLESGQIVLAGGFTPILTLRATAFSGGVTAITTVNGPISDPEISFTSEPELPEDEVLARLFFGKDITQLSPLQALQMANAVRTLAGKGGGGTLGRVREGLGLSDLDVSTDATGETAVRAGTYIGENAYTDVTTNSAGDTEINLKIDLSDTVTIKGSADNSGDTSIGVFFERDY